MAMIENFGINIVGIGDTLLSQRFAAKESAHHAIYHQRRVIMFVVIDRRVFVELNDWPAPNHGASI